jgi:hypothetical protein
VFESWSVNEAPVVLTYVPLRPSGPENPGPVMVRHARLGLTWRVVEVLEAWTHPHYLSVTFPEPAERRRYRLKVQGPLPWQPGEQGQFAVLVRLWRDRRGWWMMPA